MSEPLLVAHRGGAAEAPENTLAAFRRALSLGVRWFELDVQMSRDGELVVIHDHTVDRTTNGTGEVGSLSLQDLRKLDSGSWFDPHYRGEPVPTLREMLELCASHGAGVLVEIKSPHLYPGSEQKVATLLGEMLSDPDPAKSRRVMEAMLKMKKIDIEGLKKAYQGASQAS